MSEPTATPFSGSMAANYAEGPRRQVPGFDSLHRMTGMLLAERVPSDGRVLVLGAGGGLELAYFGQTYPGWQLDGVDPSADMLEAAQKLLGQLGLKARLHLGTIDAAPDEKFDGATALLTFHFIAKAERVATLRALKRRLNPGAPLVLAHISFSQDEPERSQWITRHVAYGAPIGTPPEQLRLSEHAIGSRLHILAPEQEEANLAEAGFTGTQLFYAGLSLRGWVAYA